MKSRDCLNAGEQAIQLVRTGRPYKQRIVRRVVIMKRSVFLSAAILCLTLNGLAYGQSARELVCYEMFRGVPSVRVVYRLDNGVLSKDDRAISDRKGLALGSDKPVRYASHKILADGRLRRTLYENRQLKKVLSVETYDFKRRQVIDERDKYNSCFRKPR